MYLGYFEINNSIRKEKLLKGIPKKIVNKKL
jgi:hypothetical protein